MRTLGTFVNYMQAGGPGSGCHGPNCGRHGGGKGEDPTQLPKQSTVSKEGHDIGQQHNGWYRGYTSRPGAREYTKNGAMVSVTLKNGKIIVSEEDKNSIVHDVAQKYGMRRVHEGTDRAAAAQFLKDKYGLTDPRLKLPKSTTSVHTAMTEQKNMSGWRRTYSTPAGDVTVSKHKPITRGQSTSYRVEHNGKEKVFKIGFGPDVSGKVVKYVQKNFGIIDGDVTRPVQE